MIRNYLTVALRRLWRERKFTLINISGLSISFCCSILIFIWVEDEVKFNRFHKNIDTIYQLMVNMKYPDGSVNTWDGTPQPLEEKIEEDYPEIEEATMVSWGNEQLFSLEEKNLKQEGYYVSEGFFDVFDFPLLDGNSENALKEKYSIIISERFAISLFGAKWQENQIIGKTILFENEHPLTITGIAKNPPTFSSLNFDFLIPFEFFLEISPSNKRWGNYNNPMFVKLKAGTDVEVFNKKFDMAIQKYRTDFHHKNAHTFLFPFAKSYLYANFENGVNAGGRITYVILFSIVSLVVLLLACINFVNLATARSMARAKEVGIRKAIGARKTSLIKQFIGEAFILALLAISLAIVLVFVLLPTFNELTVKQLSIDFTTPTHWLFLGSILFVISFAAGSYPAFFIASFKPAKVLKGNYQSRFNAGIFRKGLVLFQFTLSILMLIGTMVVYQQVEFIMERNLGLDKDNVVMVALEGEGSNNYETIKQRLMEHSSITNVSAANPNPLEIGYTVIDVDWEGKPEGAEVEFNHLWVDFDFLETMKMELAAGRDFKKDIFQDSSNYILNEAAIKAMGLNESVGNSVGNPVGNPVGKTLSMWGQEGEIIGVIKDFHSGSIYSSVKPLIIRINKKHYYLMARIAPGKTVEAFTVLEEIQADYAPSYPMEYWFLDENYKRIYNNEMVMSDFAFYFAIFGIFISCLGLYGLTALNLQQRTKEIGIRKILGAPVANILLLLSTSFFKLILVAFVIAVPIANFLLTEWLSDFAYRIELEWWFFALSGFIVLLVALLAISGQSLKAVVLNPIDSLRNE